MFRRDEKGYVMSGIGFLLLIPVMIIIPVALSVEAQSSTLPNNFVKTDVVFQAYQNINSNLNDKINAFINDPNVGVYNQVYDSSNAVGMANSIYALYTATSFTNYQNAYLTNGIYPGVLDSLNFTPGDPAASHHGLNNPGMDQNSGTIPLKNGIEINYVLVDQNAIVFNKTSKKNITYALYNMNITVNMTLSLSKGNSYNQKDIYNFYGPIPFYVNSTKTNDLKQFWSTGSGSLKQILGGSPYNTAIN